MVSMQRNLSNWKENTDFKQSIAQMKQDISDEIDYSIGTKFKDLTEQFIT